MNESLRLGKHSARHDPRTLLLADYVDASALPPVPASVDWSAKVGSSWGMMRNDELGNCTCAAAGHLVMEWTANARTEVTISDDDIVAAYSAISGYDPSTGSGDNGAVEIDVLNYWRRTGIGGHRVGAYAAVEPGNRDHVKLSVNLLEGCYIGLALPVSAERQRVWSVPPGGARGAGAPGSWGGHAVPIVAYDAHGLTCVTWGALRRMTWSFWDAYCDEAYGLFSRDMLAPGGRAPTGLDRAALLADLKLLGHSKELR